MTGFVKLHHRLTSLYRRNLTLQGFDFPNTQVYSWPVVDLLNPEKDTLKDQCIVFHSGGLESSIAALMFSGARVHHVHVPDIKTHFKGQIIESELIRLAGRAGATSCVIGLEYGPLSECIRQFKWFHPNSLSTDGQRADVTVIQPFAMTEKYDLFKQAMQRGILFCSCDEVPALPLQDWCGRCFKCFQAETFMRAARREGTEDYMEDRSWVPDNFDQRDLDRWTEELSEYFYTGNDTIMTDMYSFKAALQHLHTTYGYSYSESLRRLWE